MGGLLVATVGPASAIGWDSLTFLAAAALFSRVPVSRVPAGRIGGVAAGAGIVADFRSGWAVFVSFPGCASPSCRALTS